MITKKYLNKPCLVSLSLAEIRAVNPCFEGVEFFKSIMGKGNKIVNVPWSPLIEISYRTNKESKNFIGWSILNRLLPGHSFDGADLRGIDLSNGNFISVDFEDACLLRCNLANSDFSDADFEDANLKYADLRGSDFSYANLQGADLSKTKIDNDTRFRHAIIDSTTKFPRGFDYNYSGLIPIHLASFATKKSH